ncbi:hypothetical protein A6C57_25895 [Fibrella sp. ES10-3-2-2]
MTITRTDTATAILTNLGLDASADFPVLDSLGDSKYLRDLKINVGSQQLTAKESRLLTLSIAVNEK